MKSHCCSRRSSQSRSSASSLPPAFGCNLARSTCRFPGDPDANDDWPDLYHPMPELPSPRQRWTARRKAAVVEGVRGGWMPVEEACRLYNISVDEFLNWERDIDRNGVPGLCGAPVIKSIATQTFGEVDVT